MKALIYSDGASKGNPGDAGIGIVICDTQGKVLREVSDYIGVTTNNVAEYYALIRALHEAADLGATQIEIRTDSELLARQLSGIYKVKSANLKPLHERVTSMLQGFDQVSVFHVVRERNKRADQLANEGIRKHRIKQASPSRRAGKGSQHELEL